MQAIQRYILDFARDKAPAGRILDYGCGEAKIVEAGRTEGLDVVGADVFYAGNDALRVVTEKGLLGRVVYEITSDGTPLPDASFDLIVSNQVFEHVVDLDATLDDIVRLLKPGGTLLALFPTKDVWREGHCGLPFAHWFPSDSSFRYPYLLLLRTLGLGHFKEGKRRREYARFWMRWLDDFTHYRHRAEVARMLARRFGRVDHLEADYVVYRLRARGNHFAARAFSLPLFRQVGRWLCTKLSGVVIVATK